MKIPKKKLRKKANIPDPLEDGLLVLFGAVERQDDPDRAIERTLKKQKIRKIRKKKAKGARKIEKIGKFFQNLIKRFWIGFLD